MPTLSIKCGFSVGICQQELNLVNCLFLLLSGRFFPTQLNLEKCYSLHSASAMMWPSISAMYPTRSPQSRNFNALISFPPA